MQPDDVFREWDRRLAAATTIEAVRQLWTELLHEAHEVIDSRINQIAVRELAEAIDWDEAEWLELSREIEEQRAQAHAELETMFAMRRAAMRHPL